MEFRILGVLEALENGLPISLGGPKQRSVLTMLLLDPNQSVSTDRLVDGLWGDDPPLRAAATLHVYVSNLRKVLEPDRSPRAEPSVLLTRPPGYLLAIDPRQLDLFRFEQLVGVARSLRTDGCVAGAAVLFHEALAVWRGAPLADLADEPFARFEVPRLEEARTGAIEDRIDVDLLLGRDVELLPELEALVARNPYRERLRCQLMLALYRAGQQTDALAVFQTARRVLVEELGLEPCRELRELEAAILVHDPALAPVEPVQIVADDVARVLRTAARAEPDLAVVDAIVEEGRHSSRRAEKAMWRAIESEQASRLSETLEAAGTTQVELVRARHVIADRVLDRRARFAPRAAASGRSAPDRPGTAPVAGPCPYKGLLRFEPEDTRWYFGRERLVAELLAMVASTRCTSVVGASGSGKSSLARAGLLAALRDDALPGSAAWPRVLMTPGADPMLELARGLAPACYASSPERVRDRLLEDPQSLSTLTARALDGMNGKSRLVLVVDQLEEAFTVCNDEEVRVRFLDVLVHAASDPDSTTTVLAAIRADYYGRCAEHPDFAELLGTGNVLVGSMRPDELQRAIEEPARCAGLVLEDGLVGRIFDDVGSEPGALPLLETALLETWIRRSGHTLTMEGYAASGGVHGAVAHLADDVYERLSPPARGIARDIFLRLAEPGVGTDDVRRRAPLNELVVDDDHAMALATLVENRLVVTGDLTAEVAHEALLREWPRLRAWLEEDREGRRVQRALSNAAQDWAVGARDDDLLFRGSRLAAALDVADAHPGEINPLERGFLATSRAYQDTEVRAARRTAHRFRRLTVALGLLLVVALIAGGIALDQRQNARDEATRTRARQLAAESRSLLETRLAVPILLAEESFRLDPGAAVSRGALQASVSSSNGLERLVNFGSGTTTAVASDDGRVLAAANANGDVDLFDLARDHRMGRLSVGGTSKATVESVMLSPDGSRAGVAVGNRVVLWDVASHQRLGDFPASSSHVDGYMADTKTVFTADETGVVKRWNVEDPAHPQGSEIATGGPALPSQTPFVIARLDRQLLAVSYDFEELHLYRVRDAGLAEEVAVVPGGAGAFSPDGTHLAVSELARTAIYDISDVSRPQQLQPLVEAASPPWDPRIVFSPPLWAPDARWIAVGSFQGKVSVLKADDLSPMRDPLDIHGDYAYPLAALDGGRRIVTDLEAGRLGIWKLATRAPLAKMLGGHRDASPGTGFGRAFASLVTSAMFLGNRRLVTVSRGDGTAVVHDLRTGRARRWLPAAYGKLAGVAVSADGARVATVATDGRVAVWDRTSGTKLDDVLGPDVAASPTDATLPSLSPDGRRLAVGRSTDGTIRLWDVDERALIGQPIRMTGPHAYPPMVRAAFSPDGRTVALTAGTSNTMVLVDAVTGVEIRRIVDDRVGGFASSAWSPDGRRIATAGYSGLLDLESVWEPATGERLGSASGQQLAPFGVAFSPDGRTFATIGADGDTFLWDARSFEAIGPPLHVADPAFDSGWSVAFSPDGRRLAATYGHGKVALWDVDPESWARRACTIAGRNLTQAEWKQYLPGLSYHRTCAQWPTGV